MTERRPSPSAIRHAKRAQARLAVERGGGLRAGRPGDGQSWPRGRIAAVSALIVALAVPAFAQPFSWEALTERALGLNDRPLTTAPMPFEQPGQNFPGSAFFFLEETPRLAYNVEELRTAGDSDGTVQFAQSHPGAAGIAGPAAPAFQSAGSGVDKARALQCLSMAVYYEAASESYDGQRAVAQVVLNRVAHPAYPASVCGVVFQGSERHTGCQFTFTCDGSLTRRPAVRSWATAQSVALAALSGEVFAPVGTATHYHTHAVNPYWASSLELIGSIGAHRFYRWKGRAGLADAFSMSYRGGEPLAAPKPRAPGALALDDAGTLPSTASALARTGTLPVVLARLPNEPPSPAEAFAPARGAGPVETEQPKVDDKLPGGGGVKAEYARSGQWIRKPGS